MCAIIFTNDPKISEKDFLNSLDKMNHRGPDNTGYYSIEDFKFGHKRLSIQDLNVRSNQPLFRNDNVIIFNGEIYNFKRLIDEHNLDTKTKSDTEVILAMYEKYKSNCIKYFNGMFSFIIFNLQTKSIFIARDRLGVKPLYIGGDLKAKFTISSEIEPLVEIYGNKINDFAVRQYRKLRMCIKENTIYSSINSFPAAHYYEKGALRKYWDIENIEKEDPSDDELRELVIDAINIRKIADVSVGSYLSGGLDSSIITSILKPKYTWTVGFDNQNEFEWGKIMSNQIKSIHSETTVSSDEFIKTALMMINKKKEPLSVPNEVLIYIMTSKVKKFNTVILSGEGADELFWGYDRIFRKVNELEKLNVKIFNDYYCYGSQKDDEVIDYALEHLNGSTPILKLGYYFQIHHLSGLLRRLDNSTMLCSVEARTPFVDYRLVELMAGCSFDWRLGKRVKDCLKRVFSDEIPQEIINRKKVGFPVPLNSIFDGDTYLGNTPMDKWLNFNLNSLENFS